MDKRHRYFGIDGIQVAIYDGAVATLRWWPVAAFMILMAFILFA